MLTGPPCLAGIVRRYALADGPILDEWDDQSTYVETQGERVRRGPARLWPSWSFTVLATATEWLAWRSDLRLREFEWCPRTRRAGDPEWLEEHVYRARVRGGLRTLTPVPSRNSRNELIYVVDVVIEGVEPYEAEPGAVDGGFVLANPDTAEADGAEVLGFGSGTLTPAAPAMVAIGGVLRPMQTVTAGDAAIRAVRTRRVRGGIQIDTISQTD